MIIDRANVILCYWSNASQYLITYFKTGDIFLSTLVLLLFKDLAMKLKTKTFGIKKTKAHRYASFYLSTGFDVRSMFRA